VGAAYFLRTKHFKNGIAVSPRPFEKDYTGGGVNFHHQVQKLRGVRIAHPGILVRDSEYTNLEYVKYYDKTFGVRGITGRLREYRKNESQGRPRGVSNWKKFVEKYYPDKKGNYERFS